MSIKEMCKQAGVSYCAVCHKRERYGLSTEEAIEEVKKGKWHLFVKKIEGIPVSEYAQKYGIALSMAYRHWHAIND